MPKDDAANRSSVDFRIQKTQVWKQTPHIHTYYISCPYVTVITHLSVVHKHQQGNGDNVFVKIYPSYGQIRDIIIIYFLTLPATFTISRVCRLPFLLLECNFEPPLKCTFNSNNVSILYRAAYKSLQSEMPTFSPSALVFSLVLSTQCCPGSLWRS